MDYRNKGGGQCRRKKQILTRKGKINDVKRLFFSRKTMTREYKLSPEGSIYNQLIIIIVTRIVTLMRSIYLETG